MPSEEDLHLLKVGGLFHDIGKIGVPDSILLKTEKLTDDEYSEIKNHPTIGAHILSNATIFEQAIPIVKHHHERFDGRGYPGKLEGKNIPYLARIAAIADAYEFSQSIVQSRELSVKLEMLERKLQLSRDQIARQTPEE